MAGIVDFPDVFRGDNTIAQTFSFTKEVDGTDQPYDLTNVVIRVDFLQGRNRITLTVGNGITITDAVNGQFVVESFKLHRDGVWKYDIQFTENDSVKTFIKGQILVKPDITI